MLTASLGDRPDLQESGNELPGQGQRVRTVRQRPPADGVSQVRALYILHRETPRADAGDDRKFMAKFIKVRILRSYRLPQNSHVASFSVMYVSFRASVLRIAPFACCVMALMTYCCVQTLSCIRPEVPINRVCSVPGMVRASRTEQRQLVWANICARSGALALRYPGTAYSQLLCLVYRFGKCSREGSGRCASNPTPGRELAPCKVRLLSFIIANCKVTARSRSRRVFVFPVSDSPKPLVAVLPWACRRRFTRVACPAIQYVCKVCISISLIAYSKVTNSARFKECTPRDTNPDTEDCCLRVRATCHIQTARPCVIFRAPRQSCFRATVPKARRGCLWRRVSRRSARRGRRRGSRSRARG